MNVTIRSAKPTDIAYITDVWVTQVCRHVSTSMQSAKAKARAIIANNAQITVACLPDDQDAILGFAVQERGRVHMLYVRASARRLGVANAILRGSVG